MFIQMGVIFLVVPVVELFIRPLHLRQLPQHPTKLPGRALGELDIREDFAVQILVRTNVGVKPDISVLETAIPPAEGTHSTFH